MTDLVISITSKFPDFTIHKTWDTSFHLNLNAKFHKNERLPKIICSFWLWSRNRHKLETLNLTWDIEYCMIKIVQHILYHRDLDLWPFDLKMRSVHLCAVVHRWRKFSENPWNTFPDFVLTFWDTCTDGRTNMMKTICLWPHYIGHRHKNTYEND